MHIGRCAGQELQKSITSLERRARTLYVQFVNDFPQLGHIGRWHFGHTTGTPIQRQRLFEQVVPMHDAIGTCEFS